MKFGHIALFIMTILLISCGKKNNTQTNQNNLPKDTTNVESISLQDLTPRELLDSAMLCIDIAKDSADYVRVVDILELSTQKDSNFFAGYYMKFPFQNIIKDYQGALVTAKRLAIIMPSDPSFTMGIGASYEKMGDKKNGQKYYKLAAEMYKSEIDTSNPDDFKIEYSRMMYGFALILGNKENQGRKILKELNDSGSVQIKENVTMFIDKPRSNILIDIGLPTNMIK